MTVTRARVREAALGADLLEARLRESTQGLATLVRRALHRALDRRHDRLPGDLVLAAARCGGEITPESIGVAAAVTALRAALAQHERVQEQPPGVRDHWGGNNITLLLGDYLLVLAYQVLPASHGWQEELAEIIQGYCRSGIQAARTPPAEEAGQLELAVAQRGRLLAFCGRAGVGSGGGPPAVAAALGAFGEAVGTMEFLSRRGWGKSHLPSLRARALQALAGLPEGETLTWLRGVATPHRLGKGSHGRTH